MMERRRLRRRRESDDEEEEESDDEKEDESGSESDREVIYIYGKISSFSIKFQEKSDVKPNGAAEDDNLTFLVAL